MKMKGPCRSRKSREAATLWCYCTYDAVWLYEDEGQERTQRSGDTMPRERELLFRLSYLLPYEDEIRSVEGPHAGSGRSRKDQADFVPVSAVSRGRTQGTVRLPP